MAKPNKVTREQADAEIQNWLDKKKVYESARESNKESIEVLIEGLMRGDLILDENGSFTHNLLFPMDGFTSLTYKSRLNDKMLRPHLQGVSPKDGDGRLVAHVAALTDQPKGLIDQLDSADKKIMMSIVVFFL